MCSCVRSLTDLSNFQLQPFRVTETTEVKETRCRTGSKIRYIYKVCRETGSQIVIQFCSKSLACSDREADGMQKTGADELNIFITFGNKKRSVFVFLANLVTFLLHCHTCVCVCVIVLATY